jgi:chromosome segregation ATPase
MIEFKCQHCGKGLHLNDSYAGRDGWCRVCKRMVIVPGGGQVLRVEDLPPEEGYERLQRLLQYAATKADKYKVHLAREAKEREHAPQTEEALQQARVALAEREQALERLRDEHASLTSAFREQGDRLAALEHGPASAASISPEMEVELAQLRAELAAEREARQALSTDLDVREAAISRLEEEAAALRNVAAEAHRLEESAVAERVNLRALEGAVATLKSQLAQAESERDRLAEILEEGSIGEKDSALRLMQKDREMAALNAALAEMQAQQEESNRSTRDQIASLEAQVLLFNEIKERMAGFQGRIKDLEQERLDASLALEAAQQAEVLHQKKIGVLEVSLKQALAEQSERAIQADHFQRELAVRDEQVRKLAEELQALTEGRGTAVLEAEKSTRTARSAENRAKRLTAELGELQGVRDQLAAENEVLKRSAAELEARVTSLHVSLEAARADAAEKASYAPAAATLQAELSSALLALQRAEEEGAAEKASLLHTVAELQAEIMNLNESLEREAERTASAQAQLAALPPAEAEASSEAELRSRLEQIEALEAQLAALDEAVVRQRAEAEDGARALVASQERIAMLEAALAASGGSADGGGASRTDESDEEDVSFILLSPERTGSTGGVLEPQAIDERQRQLEKKQMMDVLTDFLNK